MINLTGGNTQNLAGVVVPLGYITFELSQDATIIASPGQVIAGIPQRFNFDTTGNLSGACKIWSNAELLPAGTSYLVNFYTQTGARTNSNPWIWVFSQSSGASVDIGTIVQSPAGNPSYPGAVLLSPSGNQIITSGNLSLAAGNLSVSGMITATGSVIASNGESIALLSRDCRIDGTFDLTGSFTNQAANAALINTCITNAISAGQNQIILPCGVIAINAAVNLTNISGVTFRGCGSTTRCDIGGTNLPLITANVTTLKCNTGNVCIDRTGSSRVTIKDINLAAITSYTSPSVIGILDARDNGGAGGGSANPFCFAEYNALKDVCVNMHHSATANSNNGVIGLLNINAEAWQVERGEETADIGMAFLTSNSVGAVSPYQTIQTGCPSSMTMITAINNHILSANTSGTTGAIISHAAEAHFINQHVQAGSSVTASCYQITATNLYITGRCENFKPSTGTFLLFDGNSDDVFFDIGVSAITAASGGNLVGFNGAGILVTNSNIRVQVTDGGNTLPFVQNIASTFQNSRLRLSNSSSPLSVGIVAAGCVIDAPNHTAGNVSFAGASNYSINDSTGKLSVSTAGGLSNFPATTGTLLQTSAAQVWNFTCTGTATANSTLTINNAGVTTCTTAGANPTSLTSVSGTLSNLQVKCGTGGVNSSSGVFTVIAALSGTSITCTTGTGTTCSDTTHTAAIAAGGQLQLRFTTQIGETLANCMGSFIQT